MKIRQASLAERVHQRLLGQIISGKRQAGEKLSEESICAEMGVSRTPAREALVKLTEEGFVERLPRRGCFVRALDRREIAELFECRRLLECQALEMGFERITTRQLDDATKLLQTEGDSETQRRVSLQADDRLHELVATACPNSQLATIIRQLRARTRPFRDYRNEQPCPAGNPPAERQAIIDAIRAGRKEQAVRLLAEHIHHGQTHFSANSEPATP